MTTRDAATYVFCLVRSRTTPSLRGVPGSVPGAGAPRVIQIERDTWAVVADAPLDRFSGERLEDDLQDVEAISRHAVAHASVVEFFFRRSPVIPLKMFTLFSTDARLCEHLRRRRSQLARLFAELEGLEEWGIRVVAGEVEATGVTTLKSGRDYLQIKKRLQADNAAPPRSSVRVMTAALGSLKRLSSRLRNERFPPPSRGRPFVIGASFLVEATRRGEWKKAVAKAAAALEKQGHRLEMTGPWPPYHFVSK